jgi:hypothetical protein
VFARRDGECGVLERELPVRYLGDPAARPEPIVLAA